MVLVFVLIGAFILALGIWGWGRRKDFSYYGKDDKKSWDWRFRQACYDNEPVYWALNTVGAILLGISLIVTIVLGVNYSEVKIIDDRISLYQEENTKIEEQVNIIVEKYQAYEKAT